MRRCLGCMREYNEIYDVCPHCGYIYGSAADSKNHLPPGTVLQNRYLLGKVLGQGGFGITYIAWDKRLEKAVAVKEFFPTAFASRMTGQNEVSCFNAESRQYFESGLQKMMTESRTLARFTDQTNIVQVLDCIEENGTAYIIMELLRGETVQSVLNRERKLPLQYTMQIILPILQVLETIHKTGLVHRDISPDNIFVCRDGKVKLLDFGAARIATGQDHKTLSIMLKKGYAPIEQYSSHGKQGPFTDVYAVCATMYKMLTGVTPENSLDRMGEDTMRPLADFADVPDPVAKVIQRGMAVEASDRIQTAGELHDRLQSALNLVARAEEKKRQKANKEKAAKNKPAKNKPAKQAPPANTAPEPRHTAKHRARSGGSGFKNKRAVVIAAVSLTVAAAIVVGFVCLPGLFGGRLNRNTKVGDVVSFGKYGLDGGSPEPIRWIVLDRVGDEALLLSEKALDCQPYHDDTYKSFTWETSFIREWLNTSFYDAAFSAEEKKRIALHENENPDNPVFGTAGCINTVERCFLLSAQEVEQYLPTVEERKAKCTDALSKTENGDYILLNGYVWWMLRSPGDDEIVGRNSQSFLSVRPNGFMFSEPSGYQYRGIRPAIWANVKGKSGSADTAWVSEYRNHLYDFSWEMQGSTLYLTGNGVMPDLDGTVWSSENRENVKAVVIGDGFTSISLGAFKDCVNLSSIEIPQGLEEIDWGAFQNCSSLKKLSLPSSVRRISSAVFYGTGIAADKSNWKDGMLCLDHCLIRVSSKATGSVTVPNTITVIADNAFYESKASYVSIPDGVTQLGDVFVYASKLQTVDLPDSIESLNRTFMCCSALQDVRLPDHVRHIKESSFESCTSLKKIVLPQSVQFIGNSAFASCKNLSCIAMYDGIEQIADDAFLDCPANMEVLFYGTQSDWDSMLVSDGNNALRNANPEFLTKSESPFAGLKKGDTVLFGSYEQDGNTANGSEAVEWIVAGTADRGRALMLVSRYALDCQPFHPLKEDVTWAKCELRGWLNSIFYEDCFSSEERMRIRPRYQTNPDNKTYKVKGGAATSDNVWLLSLPQLQSLGAAFMNASPTAYAVDRGAFLKEETGNTWWSLRTPGSENKLNALVRSDGEIRAGGDSVTAKGGVRPAIWVAVF